MVSRFKGCFIVLMTIILGFGISVPNNVFADGGKQSIPDPTVVEGSDGYTIMGKVGNGNSETPGEWYAGATPPNLRPGAPVLLFVQGLNSTAQMWWEGNDMYNTAYSAGYQTAFVQLYDAGGASADMWRNGQLLADKIKEIHSYFGSRPITVIAHSKGGVDTQTALTYYGANPYVENVITLSSPHHGSELADLAYSSWSGWLADLLGAKGDGTYVMQTGYMDYYRSETDAKALASYNDYYTLGGTDWGTPFSAMWMGGVYLSGYGDNDGVVTVSSSQLPQGDVVAIGDWNHTSIRTGLTFPVFDDYLVDGASLYTDQQTGIHEKKPFETDRFVRGGDLTTGEVKTISVPVENKVDRLTLDLLTANQLSEVIIRNPTGKQVKAKVSVQAAKKGIFNGAVHNVVQIKNPKAGRWEVEVKSANQDAYLLIANYETKAKKIKLKKKSLEKAKGLELTYQLETDSWIKGRSLKATYRVTESGNPANTKITTVTGNADLTNKLMLDKTNEVYNITIDIEGVNEKGIPFKRTIIDSVNTMQ